MFKKFISYEKEIQWIDSMNSVPNLIEAKNSGRPTFSVFGKWPVSYAYECGKGWLVLPFEAGEYDFVIHHGLPLKVELPRELSVYELGNSKEAFYLAPSKEAEKEAEIYLAQTGGRVHPTGYVPRNQTVYVSRDTFYELTGYTPREYEALRKSVSVPVFVLTEKVTDEEKYICLQVKKRAAENDKIVYPVHNSYFHLPTKFYEAAGRPASTNLPTKVDFLKKEIVIEAPVERCSCCGTIIRNKNRKPQRGLACRHCSFTIEQVREMSKDYSGETPEILTAVFNEVLSNLDKYSGLVSELINSTTHK